MVKYRSVIVRMVVVCLLLIVVGCSRVTQGNYEKIETGMTVSQVESILGEGTEETSVGGAIGELSGSAEVLSWGSETKSITVTFVNGKVVAKAQKGL